MDGNDYVGLAFDKAGNLYVAEGEFSNNQIVRYSGTNLLYPGPEAASRNNYQAGAKTVIGNADMMSYFGNLVFDAAGNLWITDYRNHRVVAFDAVALGGANSYHHLFSAGEAPSTLSPRTLSRGQRAFISTSGDAGQQLLSSDVFRATG